MFTFVSALLVRARRRRRIVARSQPAFWKVAGRASAPVPTTRLKIKMAAINVDSEGVALLSRSPAIFVFTSLLC
jgi:hypothetical protein